MMNNMNTLTELKVSVSCNNMKCLEFHHINESVAKLIKDILSNCYMDSEDYKTRTKAGAFLQGFMLDGKESWVLVEFWQPDYTPFVEHLQREFLNYLQERASIHEMSQHAL